MDNVVNLGKFRKAKAKNEKAKNAAGNRHKHGRTKGEKVADKATRNKDTSAHESRKLENPDDTEPA